jgi:hypothetical protein
MKAKRRVVKKNKDVWGEREREREREIAREIGRWSTFEVLLLLEEVLHHSLLFPPSTPHLKSLSPPHTLNPTKYSDSERIFLEKRHGILSDLVKRFIRVVLYLSFEGMTTTSSLTFSSMSTTTEAEEEGAEGSGAWDFFLEMECM